ncbi:hypothetical protein HK100_011945 [Physocladia obscura]|uniref:RING-type domain-containing protein n=1 Tax=Physocladia obscura TaxID=109957 RepID=A0AAD5TEC8_9FUNG|nr:hypothetical protein HK100_011945 [Physocladia obscura]
MLTSGTTATRPATVTVTATTTADMDTDTTTWQTGGVARTYSSVSKASSGRMERISRTSSKRSSSSFDDEGQEGDSDFGFESDDFGIDGEEQEEEEEEESQQKDDAGNRATAGDISFRSVDAAQLQERMASQAQATGDALGLAADDARLLLAAFAWQSDAAAERYCDDPAKARAQAGLPPPVQPPRAIANSQHPITTNKQEQEQQYCQVCFDSPDSPVRLPCRRHVCCAACLAGYLQFNVKNDGLSADSTVACPAQNCNVAIPNTLFADLLDPPLYALLQQRQLNTFVDKNKNKLKWCPAPACSFVVEASKPIMDTLFVLSAASPKTTVQLPVMFSKCGKKSAKTIPRLRTGSMRTPKNYSHACGTFKENASDDLREKSRTAIQRYLHYFTRYQNHAQSAKLDQALSEKIELAMAGLQENSEMSWIQVQFMKKAKETLVASRHTLKWTYSFAFYLHKNQNSTVLFEENQKDLEAAVEALSFLLESDDFNVVANIPALKSKILDKAAYVEKRREILLSAAVADLEDGRLTWSFNGSD